MLTEDLLAQAAAEPLTAIFLLSLITALILRALWQRQVKMLSLDSVAPTILETDTCNGVLYRIMSPSDAKAVVHVVAGAFFEGDPVINGGGGTLRDMTSFCEMYVPRMAVEGHTVLAVDTSTGDIIGAFLNEDFCNTDPPEFEAFLAQPDGIWTPCINMIDELEEALIEHFSIPRTNRPAGRWFHLWMLGVAPSGRGRGVAGKLAAHSVAWAKSCGFDIAFAECTGAISTHVMTKLDAERLAFCDYAKWKGEHDETLRGLPGLGHPGMSMMVVDLKK